MNREETALKIRHNHYNFENKKNNTKTTLIFVLVIALIFTALILIP